MHSALWWFYKKGHCFSPSHIGFGQSLQKLVVCFGCTPLELFECSAEVSLLLSQKHNEEVSKVNVLSFKAKLNTGFQS